MLARLISARQVVFLRDGYVMHLFYHCHMYSRPAQSSFVYLPTRKKSPYCPIWTLIDVYFQNCGPPITGRLSGQSRCLLRTPLDGSCGVSGLGPLCWGCPNEIWRS